MKPFRRKRFENAYALDIQRCEECPDWHVIFYDQKLRAFAQGVITIDTLRSLIKEKGIMDEHVVH